MRCISNAVSQPQDQVNMKLISPDGRQTTGDLEAIAPGGDVPLARQRTTLDVAPQTVPTWRL